MSTGAETADGEHAGFIRELIVRQPPAAQGGEIDFDILEGVCDPIQPGREGNFTLILAPVKRPESELIGEAFKFALLPAQRNKMAVEGCRIERLTREEA